MLRSIEVQAHCPSCGSERSVAGQLSGGDSSVAFVPTGLRYSERRTGRTSIQRVVRACSECGLVWTMLDPVDLRDRLDVSGTEETRAWLAREDDEKPLV